MRIVQDQKDQGYETPQNKHDRVERRFKSEKSNRFCGLIEGWVLDTLGRPPDFSYVRVYHLWDDRFRVNVWTKKNRISDSFFLHAVLDGITYSSPSLERKYADPAATTLFAEPNFVETASSDAK